MGMPAGYACIIVMPGVWWWWIVGGIICTRGCGGAGADMCAGAGMSGPIDGPTDAGGGSAAGA